MEFHHVSVLLNEMIDNVFTDPNGIYVDCTLGGGGHSFAMGKKLAKEGWLIGLDQDTDALAAAGKRLEELDCHKTLVHRNFQHLETVLDELGISEVDGIMFDLGVSSYQLDTAERGFSYQHDGPLDMRMDQDNPLSAEVVVNEYSEEELTRIISQYGEERWAKRIAQFICRERKEKRIVTTGELVDVIKKAIPAGARREGPHPAKRTFQAIRIEVNQELEILKRTFAAAAKRLKKGGRLGIITFHSLEDRIAKQTLRELATGCICPPELPICMCHHTAILKVKKSGIDPSAEEIAANPRARSAKLRVGIKL